MSQNLKKRFTFLNRGNIPEKKDLYYQIINLPFKEDEIKFEETFNLIIRNGHLNKDNVNYLKERYKSRRVWVKGFMKDRFCSGMCTSSRIEA